jgi:hypothetical protein
MYKFYKRNIDNLNIGVYRTNEDGTITAIPFDPENTDYQTYLKWVAEGNTPLPADE